MLLRHGITLEPGHLEKGRDLALKSLEQLDGLRQGLQDRLEDELAKAELRWGTSEQPSDQFVRLRIAAQKLADQLSEVEEMEARIERMLARKDNFNISYPAHSQAGTERIAPSDSSATRQWSDDRGLPTPPPQVPP
jgi:hypothetical protein